MSKIDSYTAIIVAAGKGLRAGLGYNKVLFYLDEHKTTVLGKTLNIFINDTKCQQINLVCSLDDIDLIKQNYQHPKINYVQGGARRQDSVYNGLIQTNTDYVLIHDGNRPYLQPEHIEHILKALEQYDSILLAMPIKDNIKEIKDGYITRSLDQTKLVSAQTPQAFKTDVIKKAYEKANELQLSVTDDISVIELTNMSKTKWIEGHLSNMKMTWSEDFKFLD